MEYPRAWSMQEHMSVPSLDSLLPKETVGTLFQESASTNTHVFVARLATCPDLSERGNVEAGDNVVIGGRVFSHASLMDGAAGSVGEFHYYASAKDASHCTIIVSFYFHSTGEAYDEPQRSQVKRGIAEMQQVIERMVQSYRDL